MRRVVDNRYIILKNLGGGGVGEVFLARDELLGRQVALKLLSRRCAGDEGFVERFRREARSAASLSHPNVVAVHDFGESRAETGTDGSATPYIVMEYVPGVTLADLLKEEGVLSPDTAAGVALGVARGLEAAHRRGVVHRDVKPANVLLTNSPGGTVEVLAAGADAVKVADFGVARGVADGTLTEENAVVGTAHYLSPEQALARPATPKSDLYSLGIVLYEMLAGQRPFEAEDAESPLAVAMSHVTQDPDPPSTSNPTVPSALDALVMRLLAKDPAKRPESAAALAEELERMAVDIAGEVALDSTHIGTGNLSGGEAKPGEPGTTTRLPLPDEAPPAKPAEHEEKAAGTVRHANRFRLAVPAAALLVVAFLVVSAGALGGERLRNLVGWVPIGLPGPHAPDAGQTPDVGGDAEAASGDTANGARFGGKDVGGAATQDRDGATTRPSQGQQTTDTDEQTDAKAETRADADGDPEEAVRQAVVEYYEAVDRESWAYTYNNLDAQTQSMFTEHEWYQKNQWFADYVDKGLELSSMNVSVTSMSPAGDVAKVNVYRTFKNGGVIDRDTVFTLEKGTWRHRLVGNELVFFMPGATYEEFVEAQ